MPFFRMFPLLLIIALGNISTSTVTAQDTGAGVSCVQVSSANLTSTYPFGVATLSFSMVGKTSVGGNVVNIALVLDGSGSVGSTNFLTEKEFAKNITTSFAEKNLFANGGSASYVQFSDVVSSSDTGTFASLDEFNDFVDANAWYGSGNTDIDEGIIAARQLLNAAPSASAAFMFVITDGQSTIGSEADDSRADGITLFAIGVGSSVDDDALLAIAGSADRVFNVDSFGALEAAVDTILGSDGTTTISCPATNVTVVVEYGALVVPPISFPGAILANDTVTVTFVVSDLEDNPTDFTVMLDTCDSADPVDPIVSITYTDDQGNSPDLTPAVEVGNGTFPPATFCPTSTPTFSPTSSNTPFPASSHTFSPTPALAPGTCRNGLPGVGGSGQCCVLECGTCVYNGCETRARKLGLSSADCCPNRISSSGPYCEDAGSAPCTINKPTWSGRKGTDGAT